MHKKTSFWLFAVLLVLTGILVFRLINIWEFLGLSAAWLFGLFLYMVGPETISEITIWKSSIKRDVKAAREIREEIEKIANDFKTVVKLSTENAIIVGSASFLSMDTHEEALGRLATNVNALSRYFVPDENAQKLWFQELRSSISSKKLEGKGTETSESTP